MTSTEQVTVILAYAAAVDPRFTTHDTDQAQARVVAWNDTLEDVDGKYALDFVRRYYRTHHDWPVTPGMIRDAWLRERRREADQLRFAALPVGCGVATQDRSPETVAVVEEARAAIAAARAERGTA